MILKRPICSENIDFLKRATLELFALSLCPRSAFKFEVGNFFVKKNIFLPKNEKMSSREPLKSTSNTISTQQKAVAEANANTKVSESEKQPQTSQVSRKKLILRTFFEKIQNVIFRPDPLG